MTRFRTLTAAATLAGCLIATPTFADSKRTVSNDVKYRDSGLRNATGRSGSATLEARALLGRDGTTAIELTTGSFDNGGATGTIARVQLKGGSSTENFNNLENNGTTTIAVQDLGWRTPVQIQTNIRDRSARTEVVTVDEVVKRRPDLHVSSISVPAQVRPNVPVTIYATVLERNGDIGARANARLLVDGVEADRAEFIWVDANGNVSVAFTHTFTRYGAANVQVVVDGVNPGDWDDANNSASQSVDVAEPFDNWAVSARERTSTTLQRSESPQWDNNVASYQKDQSVNFSGWINDPVNLFGFSLSASASTDGRTIYDFENAPFERLYESPDGQRCAEGLSYRPRMSVCSAGDGSTLVQIDYIASDAVYHSFGYDYSRSRFNPEAEPRGVYDVTSGYSNIDTPLGNTVQWDVRFTDGDGAYYRTQPFLASFENGEWHTAQPRRCSFARFYGFTICSTYKQDDYWRQGSASGSN